MRSPRAIVVGLLMLGGSLLPALAPSASAATLPQHLKAHASATTTSDSALEWANALSVQWVSSSWAGSHGTAPAERSVIHASLQYASAATLRDAELTFTTRGPVRLITSPTVSLGTVRADHPTRFRIAFEVYAGGCGEIQVKLSGVAPGAAALRYLSPLTFATGAGRVAFSPNGLLPAQENALALQEPRLGHALYRQRLFALEGGGARVTFSEADGPDAVPANTVVHGTVEYEDRNGPKHPARDVYVQIWDLSGAAPGTHLTTVFTNAAGAYTATVSTLRPNHTARSLYVQPLAANAGFQIVAAFGATVPQHIDSPPHAATGATQTVNLVANNSANNNTAFDVADMLVTGDAYVLRIHGSAFPRITAAFPDAAGTDFIPSNNTAEIVQGDRFDWDVVLHEFGHYVAANLKIDTSKGGHHGLGQNLGEPPPNGYGKNAGIQLAWSEGFATWFSLTAQYELNVAAMHIPYAGDWTYDDTEDANIMEPINNQTVVPSLGEDNEVSVARFLYQVLMNPAIRMTDTTIIDALVNAKANTLATALTALMKADDAAAFGNKLNTVASEEKMNDFACVLTTQAVSPQITSPSASAVATSTPTEFDWTANGAGPSNRLNDFDIQFWSPTWGKLLWEGAVTPFATTANSDDWTPTQAQWNAVMAQMDESQSYPSKLNVMVVGTDTNSPVTGPYGSCAVSLSVAPITVTATAVDASGVLAPSPADAGLCSTLPSDLDQFTLNASNLIPNSNYSVQLYDPNNNYGSVGATNPGALNGYPTTGLTPSTAPPAGMPPNTVSSNSLGDINGLTITIPDIPSQTNWPLILTPLGTQGQTIAGRIGTTTVDVGFVTCGETPVGTGSTTLYWDGNGAVPSTGVTLTWDAGTMYQTSETVGSLSDGDYYYNNTNPGPSGPLPVYCQGGGADTVTINLTTFSGAQTYGPFNFTCNEAGPDRGQVIARYGEVSRT
jgi:hypothetical protein